MTTRALYRTYARIERAAREMTWAVFAALNRQLSPGEADEVLAQLPKEIKRSGTESRLGPPAVS